MTHADAFLQHILERPDDDAPRLIYADWLEEQGDPESSARAEFIRVQCALAARHLPQQRRTELERCQFGLLYRYGKDWARSIRRLVQNWEYHRGFIEEVAMPVHTFLAHAGRLFCRAPIQHLRFMYSHSFLAGESISMAALADSEHLRRLRFLDLSCNGLESHHVRALMVSPHLISLTSLNLACNRIGESGIRALAEAPLLTQLRHLDLQGNVFGAVGFRVLIQSLESLARSSGGLRLQMLDARNNKLGRGARRRLLPHSPLLRQVIRW